MSDKVFIYWDNSNIFHEAQRLADERDAGENLQPFCGHHFMTNPKLLAPRRHQRRVRREG